MTTDRVFQDVFRHLGLREFRIYAASPMKNVSLFYLQKLALLDAITVKVHATVNFC